MGRQQRRRHLLWVRRGDREAGAPEETMRSLALGDGVD